jgi:hypothetical protein
MTPPAKAATAFYFGNADLGDRVTEVQMLGVALDRALGTDPDRLERACRAPIFSEPTQTRLLHRHLPMLRAHEQCTGVRAAHLIDVPQALGAVQPVGVTRTKEAAAKLSDWANLLENTLDRRLLISYAEANYGEQSLFRPGRTSDFRARRVVNLVEAQDLSTVTENNAFTDITVLTDSTLNYTISKKGNLVPITWEIFKNDDVGGLTRMIDIVGRAARRTLARAIWSLWSSNATYGGDATAWFAAGHNNTATTAISKTAVIAAIAQLLAQTRPGGTEKLGLRAEPGTIWLVVPNVLFDTAYALNQEASSALYHLFGDNNEYIIVNPLLSDGTDWGVHLDSRQVESVVVDFLDAKEEPEIVLADAQQMGDMFGNDRLRYRIKHTYGVAVADFRGAVKNVVAG